MQMNTKGYENKIYQDPEEKRKEEEKDKRDNIFFYVLIVVILLLLLGCCCLASTNNVLPNFFGGALSNIGTNLSSITGIGNVNIDGTEDQVIVQSDASGNFVLLTPQPISTTSSPTFSGMTLSNYSGIVRAEDGRLVAGPLDLDETNNFTNALNVLNGGTGQTTAPTLNQILVGDGNGGYRQLTITAGGGIDISSNGSSLTISNTSMGGGGGGGGGGTVMSVTAGNGLVNSGTLTDPVIEMISLNAGLVINADDIALNLATSGTSTTTNSNSGLEITAAGLRLLGGCSNNQILKWNSGTSLWECSADATGAPGSGITSLNGLTDDTQTFATGTSGSDFNIVSAGTVHTFNIPSASTTARGLVTTGAQTFGGDKTFANNVAINGNTTIGATDSQTVTFNALVSSNIRPATDNTYDLGSLATRWRDLYLGPSSLRITSTTGTSGTGANYTLFAAGYNSGTATLQTTNFGTNTSGNFGGIELISGINTGQGANQAINLRASNNLGATDSLLRVGDSGSNILNVLGNGQTTLATDTLTSAGDALNITSSTSGLSGGVTNLINSTMTLNNSGVGGSLPAARGFRTSVTNLSTSTNGAITGIAGEIVNQGIMTNAANGIFSSVTNSTGATGTRVAGFNSNAINQATATLSESFYNNFSSQTNSGSVGADSVIFYGQSTTSATGSAQNQRGAFTFLTNDGTLSDNIVGYDNVTVNNLTTTGYNGFLASLSNNGDLDGTNPSSLFGGIITNSATGTTDELDLLRLTINNQAGGVIDGQLNLAFVNSQIAGSVTGDVYGYRSEVLNQATGTIGGDIFGVSSSIDLETSSTFGGSDIYQFYGTYDPVGSRSGIAGVSHYGLYVTDVIAGQNNYGVRVNNVGGCGTCTNGYGMYVGSVTGSTNNYGIYIQDATTYAMWVDSGITRLDGQTQIGTTGTPTSWLSLGAATTTRSSLNIASSAATNVSSPVSGDLWWNGTELFFYNGSTNVNLLAGGGGQYVEFQSGTPQTNIDNGSPLIDLEFTENLSFFGSTLFRINNTGGLQVPLLTLQENTVDVFVVQTNGLTQIQNPNNNLGSLLEVSGGITVDTTGLGNTTLQSGLIFGNVNSGEGISSNRSGAGFNQNGLDLYTNNSNRFGILNDGEVYVNVLASGTGDAICRDSSNNNILTDCNASSRALKDNIENLEPGLQAVLDLRPVTFAWKDSGAVDLGFIAEEVYAVNPLFAVVKEGEVTGVKYRQLSALLVKAVQDLNARVDGLENRIANLEDAQTSGNTVVSTGAIEKFIEVKNMNSDTRILLTPRSSVPTGVTYYAESRENGFVIKLSTTVRRDISFDYLLILD